MKIKALIEECIKEIILEDLEVPSRDGTANGASEEDKQKAKQASMDGKTVDFVKPGEIDEKAIPPDEAKEKVMEVYQALSQASEGIAELEDFANESNNSRMKKLTSDLGKRLKEANQIIGELKKVKDELLQEEAEKASSFGDKVINHLGKHLKKEGSGANLKKKYMPFIHKAFAKGKSAKEVADRIKDHRFEI